jgi:hypothetical protein
MLSTRPEEPILEVLKSVCLLLEEPFNAETAAVHFASDGNSDITNAMKRLIVADVSETSDLAAVMKLCCLNLVAPAVMFLKSVIGERYPYKDARGCWTLALAIDETRVTATHSKIETSMNGDLFQFW